MKYEHVTHGQVKAAIDRLGGMEGLRSFLAGKLTILRSTHTWHEQGGVIYFSVTSDGTTGPQWIERLKAKGLLLGNSVKDLLLSPDFQGTSGVITNIAIIKGVLFHDNDRITNKIRAEASTRKLEKPNAEVACLIREMFSDEELKAMGLEWIIVMHEPIKYITSDGLCLLVVGRSGFGRWLDAHFNKGKFERGWSRDCGFAFAVSSWC